MDESLTILKQVESKYKELIEWGYNKPDAGERCVKEIDNAPCKYLGKKASPFRIEPDKYNKPIVAKKEN